MPAGIECNALDLNSGFASLYKSIVYSALVVGLAFFNDDKVSERDYFRLLLNHVGTIFECYTQVQRVGSRREEFEVVELIGDC